jgi:hypothetical protein
METENHKETTRVEAQARVDRGVEKLNADLGPIWPSRIDLDDLSLHDGSDCILGQLFDGYHDGTAAMWPDAPTSRYRSAYCCDACHGSQEQYEARLQKDAQVQTRDELAQSHGFLDDEDNDISYSDLQEIWEETIRRLRAEPTEGAPQ